MKDGKLALFVMLGQTAERLIQKQPDTVAPESLPLSKELDLAVSLPILVKRARLASLVFKYFFVFEHFLREFIRETLSESSPANWWESKVPKNIRDEVTESEQKEETKAWMALVSREKLALTTYPQLLSIIESCWKDGFEPIVRDKSLIQEARLITHVRNAACHMSDIPEEEVDRVRQVMRDWFRIVSP
ncbi:MAG: Swt1 family HEPN domain-containing protein [Bdellovibrionota bacterium]